MVTRSRFSTTTVVDPKYLVPWLAAEGHLAYSPTEPPARDYFFQYTWILPGIFNPKMASLPSASIHSELAPGVPNSPMISDGIGPPLDRFDQAVAQLPE